MNCENSYKSGVLPVQVIKVTAPQLKKHVMKHENDYL